MPPNYWATVEQRAWLQSKIPEFIQRQAENKLGLFWPTMQEEWFRRWPEQAAPNPDEPVVPLTAQQLLALGAAILVRKNKLENYFRNNTRNLGNPLTGSVAGVAAAAIRKMFNMGTAKKQRVHQPIEVFQKRNPEMIRIALDQEGYNVLNEEKMAEEIDDWADESKDTEAARKKATKSQRMRLRTRVVRALFDEASEEELAAIEAEIEEERVHLNKTVISMVLGQGVKTTHIHAFVLFTQCYCTSLES
ncbi:hypothetical protein C8R43DRAFT_955042 [Mycena crocata]|nr:hypothetical protein C8R43DRAFT_955042 [Mycena crocata]